jgi:hypothetical protein
MPRLPQPVALMTDRNPKGLLDPRPRLPNCQACPRDTRSHWRISLHLHTSCARLSVRSCSEGFAQSEVFFTQALKYLAHLFPLPVEVFFLSGHRTERQSPQATSPKPKSHSTPRILKMGPCGNCNCCSGGSCGESCKCTSCGVRLFSPSPKDLF